MPQDPIRVSEPCRNCAIDAAAPQVSVYHISNMDCPTEEGLIRGKLEGLPGVLALGFNLVNRVLTVTHTLPSPEPIARALADIGMETESVTPAAGLTKTTLSITKMDCPTEEGLIRSRLGNVAGVGPLEFNLDQRTLTVTHDPNALPAALAALAEIGMPAEVSPAVRAATTSAEPPETTRTNWWLLGVAGASAVAAEVVEWSVGGFHIASVVLAIVAILAGGLPTYRKGWIAVRNLNLNMNALMSIAVTGAMIIGYWPEAAMVMFLFALAEVIEAKSLDRARRAIRELMSLAPETVTLQQLDGSWREVEAASVAAGTIARARPGERIALDGVIVSGASTVNQAPITGESLPVEKAAGDAVFAGTINQAGSFEYRVTATASDSTLARIIHAVEAAQGSRAPTQRFVDRFSRVYTPVVFIVAIAFAVVPPLFFGGAWMDWLYRSLVLLVIACPCALVISTPVTIVSGLAAAARKGILIKGGAYLEEARRLTLLALDKTGTLTYGRPEQTDFQATPAQDEGTVRRIAASLATRSDHPVSAAVARAAAAGGIKPFDVENFKALLGRGVEGGIQGKRYHLGNHRLMRELGLAGPEMDAARTVYEQQGKTVIYLADASGILGLFAVADTVRQTSRQAVAALHALGVKTVLLTGDNAHTAAAIAREVGIDEARGEMLPEDKLRAVEEFIASGEKVGMIGDGINDAPALARADLGIAMGAAGTDTAIETADVALMDDDLRKVHGLIILSRRTGAILLQNIVLALGIKVVFIAMALAGTATMWMAVFADMGASMIVVFNGLRLLRKS